MMKFSFVFLSLFISPEVFARPSTVRNHNVGKPRHSRSPRRQGRVMGGTAADITDYPYAVSLKKFDISSKKFLHHCGGSLISNLHVITAAHCVLTDDTSEYRLETGVQDTRRTEEERTHRLESILKYPEYNIEKNRGIDNDIALIKLSDPVEFTEYAQPINLFKGDTITESDGIIVGWGLENGEWNGKPTHELKKAEMPLRSNNECKEMLNTVMGNRFENGRFVTIRKRHLCAGHDEGGIDGCKGDSGAGLVISNGGDFELIGIMSGGISCGEPLMPGVYQRISEYRDWIKDNIN